MMALSRRRKCLYALLTVSLVSGVVVALFVAADVYVHWRTQDLAGVNVWGYHGAPIGDKRAGETRVAMLGGSTVYGWGLPSHESIPAFLERRLNDAASGRRYSVVNLGAPGEGAYGFRFELADFEYLDYDVVLLYEGYNDLASITPRGQNNYLLWRRESPIFRWTGYYPILPVVLREKSQVLLTGAPGPGDRARFEPGLAARAAAGAMRAAAALTSQLGGQPGGLSATPADAPVDDECIDTWKRYCGSVRDAVEWTLARNKPVIVITQPYLSDMHVEQQANLAAMLRARFGADRRVRYVNLGHTVDMRDRSVAYDGIHLVATGNDLLASHLVSPVLEISR